MMKEGSMNIKMGTGRIEVGYPGSVSGSGAPKRLSANSSTLCGAEWSWSPAHSRADTYSLHSGRRDWFLWLSYYDDYFGRIERNVIGRMPKIGVDADAAARALLTAFWRFDNDECDVDRPHYCDAGALSSETLQEIMDAVWGSKSIVSPELLKAYENTDFCVLEPNKFTLRIGSKSPDLAKMYIEMGVHSAGFLTASNPYSGEVTAEQNKRALNDLSRALSLDGLPTLIAIGVDPSGEWPGEESFLVPGISIERAKMLGAEFEQNAIVWAGPDAVPSLILLR
jgi:hypothetical protein